MSRYRGLGRFIVPLLHSAGSGEFNVRPELKELTLDRACVHHPLFKMQKGKPHRSTRHRNSVMRGR